MNDSLLILSERSLHDPQRSINENHSSIEEEHRAVQQEIILQPLNQHQVGVIIEVENLGKPVELGYFLVTVLGVKSVNSVLQDYITSDERGEYNHPYIGEVEGVDECLICDGNRSLHISRREEGLGAKSLRDKWIELKHALSQPRNMERLRELLKSQDCEICFNTTPLASLFYWNNECHNICLTCIKSYLIEEINVGKVQDLKCPHCLKKFENDVIKQLLSEQMYQKYTRFVSNNRILADPLLRWCPNPSCSVVVKIPISIISKFTCESCKTEICLKCNREAHDPLSCDQILEKELANWSSAKDVQRCPHCKVVVEKASGCNHMTCHLCHHEWCWLCGSVYTSYHHVPFNPLGCPGLQGGGNRSQQWGFWRLNLWRLLIFLLIIIGLPFLLVFFGPIVFIAFMRDTPMWRSLSDRPIWKKPLFFTLLLTLAIILMPVFTSILIICMLPFLIVFIVQYVNQRLRIRRRNQQYQQNLRMEAASQAEGNPAVRIH